MVKCFLGRSYDEKGLRNSLKTLNTEREEYLNEKSKAPQDPNSIFGNMNKFESANKELYIFGDFKSTYI